MIPLEQLQKVVNDLFGDLTTTEQIAALCRERQVQGFMGNCTSCPMVKLVRELLDFPVAFTLGKKIESGQWLVVDERPAAFVSPLVCSQFADAFDSGTFKDLIAFGEPNAH